MFVDTVRIKRADLKNKFLFECFAVRAFLMLLSLIISPVPLPMSSTA